LKEIEDSVSLIMTMVEDGPKELQACEALWDDGANTVNWIMHHLSPTQMIGNIAGNLFTHMVAFATDLWTMIAAGLHGEYYDFGKHMAEIIMMLIN